MVILKYNMNEYMGNTWSFCVLTSGIAWRIRLYEMMGMSKLL